MILLHILTFILFFLVFIIIVLLRHGRGVSALMTVRMIVIQRECDCCLDLDLTGVSIELLFLFLFNFLFSIINMVADALNNIFLIHNCRY